MPSLDESYRELVRILSVDAPAASLTTPGDGWEAVARLILARGRRPNEIEAAIAALQSAGLSEAVALAHVGASELIDTLSDLGVRVAASDARMLLRLAGWYADAFPSQGDSAGSTRLPETLRQDLRAIRGVGPATADAILLAIGLPCFPVEQGIYRILVRHGWCDITADYDEAREIMERHAGPDPAEIELVSEGLSRLGRKYCSVRAPKCDRCPLQALLPDAGPINPYE